MMESLEFPNLWSVEEESALFPSDLLPKDGLDCLLDDLTSDLLFKPTDDASVDVGSAIGDFEDWLDLKMDFSILDGMEDQDLVPNDPARVMEKERGTDFALSPMEKQSKTLSYATYTPPSSPEGQVPDYTRPIGITYVDRNLFASDSSSPPVSPPSSASLLPTEFVNPIQFLKVIIENPASAVIVPPEQVADIARREDIAPVKKKSKPYSRPERKVTSILKPRVKSAASCSSSSSGARPVNKKERKRVQNKDAATRYRKKKRVEAQSVEEQEGGLLDENQKLQVKAQQLSTEISYLKKLMREMFRARGLFK